jgi:hypothetical protein
MSSTSEDGNVQSMRFDRRTAGRAQAAGHAIATFAKPEGGTFLVRVELLDSSRAGLGVLSDTPVTPGCAFGLFPDDVSAPAYHGKVARCTFEGGKYRIGLQRLMRDAA